MHDSFDQNLAALEDPAGKLAPGTFVDDRFQIERFVGAGGMGFIYRGVDLESGEPVALKVLRTSLVGDKSSVKRFAREAWTISQIEHPNVVDVITCRRSREGLLYIAMEWIDGLNLAQVLEMQGPMDPTFVAWIGMNIARALVEAHEKGIVHRDLKPENVLLKERSDAEGLVKVLDFGIAKLTDEKYAVSKLTQAGTVCGTPEYMSPEQARGDELDGRSDVYSLGCLLFTLLHGEPPFDGATPMQVLFAHIGSPLPPLPPGTPPLLGDVVIKAAAKSPLERYPDARAMANALELAFDTLAEHDADRQELVESVGFSRTVVEPLQALGLSPTISMPATTPDLLPGEDEEPTNAPPPTSSVTGNMPQVDIEDARPTLLFDGGATPAHNPVTPRPGAAPPPYAAHPHLHGPVPLPRRRLDWRPIALAGVVGATIVALALYFALTL